jgi:uncharacterized damage-inducible protein DinB
MGNLEFCIARRKAESPAFVRVLKAVPQDRLDYRPDPKARTAAELAWFIAVQEAALVPLLETGTVDWMVALYERSAAALNERLGQLDEAAWQKSGRFLFGGSLVWEAPIGEMVWGFLFDAIHHRGQLSTYLRPMGSKVPSIYGPSADDSGQ